MRVTPGIRLGHYQILSALGAGGMGEVYRARDTKLNRDVAIKVLPAAFAQDYERVARFRREAQVLASLNHPNIAAIYGLEESNAALALAIEFVDGEDVAERLATRGAMPVDDAVAIAAQVAQGLEAAHEKGIVHRDLKPANIKVASDGTVKILDFGLAKAYEGDANAAGASGALAHSPTMSRHMTEAGLILGTAAYMAPEQARGMPIDKRADIWAFGVVLYEVLSGLRLFEGATVSDVLAAVLRQDIDLGALPADTPAPLRRLIARCLARDPKQRLRDIGEARVLLSEPFDVADPSAGAPARRPAAWPRVLPWVVAVMAVLAAAIPLARRPAPVPAYGPETLRFVVPGPDPSPGLQYSVDPNEGPLLSPDGRTLALPLESPKEKALHLRPLNGFGMIRVDGGGRRPFFSPNGGAPAFVRGGAIWKMDIAERQASLVGHLSEVLWDLGFPAWHPDGRLLIPGAAGLWSLPASGGDATLLVSSDAANRNGSRG